MRKLNLLTIIILLVLISTILLIVQNNLPVKIQFLTFKFDTTVGLFAILMFIFGAVSMWLISLVAHYREISELKKQLFSKEKITQKDKEEDKGKNQN